MSAQHGLVEGVIVPDIEVDLDGGLLRITLNRPRVGNSLNPKMADDLAVVFEEVARAEDIRAVVLSGAGDNFCLGLEPPLPDTGLGSGRHVNIGQHRHAVHHLPGAHLDIQPTHSTMPPGARITQAIVRLEKPVLAAVHGQAVGLGCALAVACDVIVATESASFLLAPLRSGQMPDGGLTATLSVSLGRHRAMRMALLGDPLSAVAAYDAGLVAAVTREEHFHATIERLCRRLMAGPTMAFENTKRAINAATMGGLNQALSREARAQIALTQTNQSETKQAGLRVTIPNDPLERVAL